MPGTATYTAMATKLQDSKYYYINGVWKKARFFFVITVCASGGKPKGEGQQVDS